MLIFGYFQPKNPRKIKKGSFSLDYLFLFCIKGDSQVFIFIE